MTTSNSNRICIEEYVDAFLAENAALRRKLQSKAEALLILSKELTLSRTERDQFKLMAEQLRDRCASLKRTPHHQGGDARACRTAAQVLGDAGEASKALRVEVEDLRQKLHDAQGDIKVLRQRGNCGRTGCGPADVHGIPAHQREELVQQLETSKLKCGQLEADLQAVLDEKEELVTERDAYKCKAHRLNHELHALLRGDTSRAVDVDALVMENRYLQERLQQTQDEKELASQALAKYKAMLEKKRGKGAVRLGAGSSAGLVVSHRQVQQLLERGTAAQLPNTAATLAHMRSLCLGLLDALSDKTLALTHQRRANRILAGRIEELEHRLQGCHVGVFPSQLLLDGYTSSQVDRDASRLLDHSPSSDCDSDAAATSPATRNIFTQAKLFNLSHHDAAMSRPQASAAPCEPMQQTRPAGAHTSTSLATNTGGDCDGLPEELQQLVQKALCDLQEEMQRSCPSLALPP